PVPDAPIDSTPPPPPAIEPGAGEAAENEATTEASGGGGGEGLLLPPVVLKAAWLEYPKEARKRKSEGDVELRILVNESGGVSAVEIEKGSSDPLLDQAAIDAARTMRFRAARQGTRPVAVWFNYQFSFRLPNSQRS
ncbi:MAG TPA: energy transducer TonB, partial [Candidatus Eisenbacteria bacterium]